MCVRDRFWARQQCWRTVYSARLPALVLPQLPALSARAVSLQHGHGGVCRRWLSSIIMVGTLQPACMPHGRASMPKIASCRPFGSGHAPLVAMTRRVVSATASSRSCIHHATPGWPWQRSARQLRPCSSSGGDGGPTSTAPGATDERLKTTMADLDALLGIEEQPTVAETQVWLASTIAYTLHTEWCHGHH